MAQTIKQAESYLASQNILVDDSEFLRAHIKEEKEAHKIGFDPRDMHGARLAPDWQPGDTVWSVSIKRLFSRLQTVFNPDTYSLKKYNELRRTAALHKLQIYSAAIIMTLPLIFGLPFLIPKLKRIKREFLLNKFMKRRFYEEELKVQGQQISRAQMESIVAEAYRSHNI